MKLLVLSMVSASMLLVSANNMFAAAASKSSAKPVDVPEFLRLLDAELTDLDRQLTALYSALPDASTARQDAGATWSQAASLVRATALKIRDTVRHYRLASGGSPSRSSQKMLESLQTASLTLAHTGNEVQHTRNATAARAMRTRLSSQAIAIVRRAQILTDGFASLTCNTGQSYCCVARTIKDGATRIEGCRWTCTQKPRACRSGLFGSSSLATEPGGRERLP